MLFYIFKLFQRHQFKREGCVIENKTYFWSEIETIAQIGEHDFIFTPTKKDFWNRPFKVYVENPSGFLKKKT
jgi:hypothetical protein